MYTELRMVYGKKNERNRFVLDRVSHRAHTKYLLTYKRRFYPIIRQLDICAKTSFYRYFLKMEEGKKQNK